MSLTEKEKRRNERSKRKTERNRIKKIIKTKINESWDEEKIDLGFHLDIDKKIWKISWHIYKELPEDLDVNYRENLVQEPHIIQYAEDIYQRVVNHIEENLDIKNSRKGHYLNDKWFTLTVPFPPMESHIWAKYDYVDGVWTKVQNARLLTDEEKESFLMKLPEDSRQMWEKFYEHDKRAMEYYEFDEEADDWNNWRLKRYVGIRMYGTFELDAIGGYMPSYLN